jgi:ATP-binding protein involved in chromosome partitioning
MPVRGVIENMSYWLAPDGQRHAIFGSGGGQALADDLDVPLLGCLPLETAVREGADEGEPALVAAPEGEVAGATGALATAIAALGPARVYRSELTVR